ncbi:MAG: ArsR/SmtB family transcription factor [Bryobacteraceae bacterium]
MNRQARRALERRAAFLKALAHPSRLMLVEELGRGERCVCELHDLAGGDFSTVSRHLAQLRRAGLLEMEKRGLNVFYRLKNPRVLRLLEWADRVIQSAAREARN